ncbi:MAG: glycosyltransferase [Lysobacteraceae bacterium]
MGTTESSSSDRVIAPVVSVMIMVYNHERYLAEAISSVLEQDVDFPMEVLIGEDCSSDRSRQIALDFERRYPSVVRLITSEENVGAFQNYRRLLSAARGEFGSPSGRCDDYRLPESSGNRLKRFVYYLPFRPFMPMRRW